MEAPEALQAVAARVRAVDPATLLRIMHLVGLHAPGDPITILLATEDTPIARQTPRSIAGFAHSAEGAIVLFPARSLSYPYDSLDDVVRHEIAHVLIARAAKGGLVPRWFHEGLALVTERSWGLTDRTRVALALTRTRWSAAELDAAFSAGGRQTAAAYAVSGAIVRDIMRRSGEGVPADVLQRVGRGEPFELAFARAAGESVRTAHERFWRESWWSELVPFLTSSAVIWLVVMLLGLLAIRTRRARNAARRAAWEREEQMTESPVERAAPGDTPPHG